MLNPIEEAKFAELKAMCRELKIPAPPEIMIGLKVHDKNGILVFDDIQRGHSWNRNFYNSMFGFCTTGVGDDSALFGAGYMSGKRTSGTIDSTPTQIAYYNNQAAALNTGFLENDAAGIFGIKIGTGDTAFSPEQFVLVAAISHGIGSGQMSHVAMSTYPTRTIVNKVWKATITRFFNNNSGSSITVKETGLYSRIGVYVGSIGIEYMFERTVLETPVAVANGAQLTVTYEISMDFSAID